MDFCVDPDTVKRWLKSCDLIRYREFTDRNLEQEPVVQTETFHDDDLNHDAEDDNTGNYIFVNYYIY